MNRDEAIERAIREWHSQPEDIPANEQRAIRHGVEVGIRATSVSRKEIVEPLDVILFCPKCKAQHIDKAEPDVCESCGHPESEHFGHKFDDPDDIGCYACGGITKDGCQFFVAWLNPPHKKHRCHKCNHVWKPAMIQTNGVAEMEKEK
jgi:hypothetical protein